MRRAGGLRRRLVAGIGLLTILFLAVLGVMLLAIHELRQTDRAASRTADVVVATSRAQGSLQELETALRLHVQEPTAATRRALAAATAKLERQLEQVERTLDGREDAVSRAIRAEAAQVERFVAVSAAGALAAGAGFTPRQLASAELAAERSGVRLNRLVERGRARLLPRRERTGRIAAFAEIVGILGIVAVIAVAAGCLVYVQRAVLRPLRSVSDAARRLHAGDLRARVAPRQRGGGEVSDLARTFDKMAASLEDSRAALQRQNAELESRGAELVDAVRSAREGASVLRAVLDATPDAIALLDRDGATIVDNPPMRTVRAALGPRAAAIDANGALVPLDAGVRTSPPGDDGAEKLRDEVVLVGTRRAFARYAAPVRDSHERVIGRLLVLREVTREREAERVKEEFFALVSHELRTPLTAILGYVELVLGEESALDADQQRYLEIVERNAQRLLRLVGDLLFAAQVESGALMLEPGIVDLPQIAREAVEAARPRAEDAGIALDAEIAAVAPTVGDRDRLAQVLDNLISNALKFTPSGGRVDVRLDADDGAARIEVADTGVGVSRDEQEHMFDRFFRASNATTRAVPGVGLGLMIVRAIVIAHGGEIAVRSAPGAGTAFTVRLPLRAAPADSEAAAPLVPYRELPAQAPGYPAGGR